MNESIEKFIEPFAVEGESRGLGRPGELIAARHRGDPDLADGGIRADDELRGRRLVEDELHYAVLQLDLEIRLVCQRRQGAPRLFEGTVGLKAEFLLGQRGYHCAVVMRSGDAT